MDVTSSDYRPQLKKVHYSTEPHIIVSVEYQRIFEVIYQAREVNMLDEYRSYIITSLDAHTIDFARGE